MRKLRFVTPLLMGMCLGCASHTERGEALSPAAARSEEQATIDAATNAVRLMRQNPNFRGFDYFAARARGVLIFPNTVKAAFLVGGEGGKGVLLARNADGSWSPPAFYGIGAGSVGFQVGYQRASIVLFLMNERTLMSVIDRGLTLGADASVAAGTVGETGRSINATTSSDVVQFVDAGGLFAGVSLNGAVVSARTRANHLYYGPQATTTGIIIDRLYEHPASRTLRDALSGR